MYPKNLLLHRGQIDKKKRNTMNKYNNEITNATAPKGGNIAVDKAQMKNENISGLCNLLHVLALLRILRNPL